MIAWSIGSDPRYQDGQPHNDRDARGQITGVGDGRTRMRGQSRISVVSSAADEPPCPPRHPRQRGARAGALAAWFVPPLAVVVVWPILIVVPGWVAITGLRSRIDAAGRLGLAVILTVAVSTHLVHWLSHLAGGYGRGVVFAVAALLGLALPLAAWRGSARRP